MNYITVFSMAFLVVLYIIYLTLGDPKKGVILWVPKKWGVQLTIPSPRGKGTLQKIHGCTNGTQCVNCDKKPNLRLQTRPAHDRRSFPHRRKLNRRKLRLQNRNQKTPDTKEKSLVSGACFHLSHPRLGKEKGEERMKKEKKYQCVGRTVSPFIVPARLFVLCRLRNFSCALPTHPAASLFCPVMSRAEKGEKEGER